MEYIDGLTLDEYIGKVSGPMQAGLATRIAGEILDAIQYAHDHQVFHRDIKPGNIMINRDASVIRIMDFGIAKLTGALNLKTTHARTQLGTPFYMSPEQVKGLPYTAASDIYSFGVTLYEMLTGVCPYHTITNLFELQTKIVTEPLPPTERYYPNVPPYLQAVIAKATHKTPELRFPSCAVFRAALAGPGKVGQGSGVVVRERKAAPLPPPPKMEQRRPEAAAAPVVAVALPQEDDDRKRNRAVVWVVVIFLLVLAGSIG